MDYVPQEIGVYDTSYDHLSESECRACHGDSLASRHHYSQKGMDNMCDACHDILPDPPGITIIRDCVTSGCHSWEDVPANGWHHNTDLTALDNCIVCHNPNLVGEIVPFASFEEYPPAVITPTPFSCENCHWDQAIEAASPGFDPDTSPTSDAGHPSTYGHYNAWDQFVGYHEYGSPIIGNSEIHHMGFKSGITSQCDECHGSNPNNEGWDPYNPELIRYCERCHSIPLLHGVNYHAGADNQPSINAWKAAGFHTETGTTDCTDVKPTVYETFTGNDRCFGCHAGGPVSWFSEYASCSPAIRINPQGITPNFVGTGTLVELTGECFGGAYGEGKSIQLKKKPDGDEWIDLPGDAIHSWSDSRIQFFIPYYTLTPGNYWVRVYNEDGSYKKSNQVVLTYWGG